MYSGIYFNEITSNEFTRITWRFTKNLLYDKLF